MTNQQHPITPPPELVEEWGTAPEYTTGLQKLMMVTITTDRLQEIATQAAQWGADQELKACCGWLGVQETRSPQWFDVSHDACALVSDLRAARRPKPQPVVENAPLSSVTLCHISGPAPKPFTYWNDYFNHVQQSGVMSGLTIEATLPTPEAINE